MATPNFLLAAVESLITKNNAEPLKQAFLHGIRLESYPESRDLIIKLLDGKPIRDVGSQGHIHNEKKETKLYAAKMMFAELVAAGMQQYSSTSQNTASHRVVKKMYSGRLYTSKMIYAGKVKPKILVSPALQRFFGTGKNNITYHLGKSGTFSARGFYDKVKDDQDVLRQIDTIKGLIDRGVINKSLILEVHK